MKRLLPGKEEFAILLTLCLLCTAIVRCMPEPGLGLLVATIPLFVISAVMGMRRCDRYAPVRETVRAREESTERAA